MDYHFSIEQLPVSLGSHQMELGYRLSNGTILFASARDSRGYYPGIVGLDGMYLCTGVQYTPVYDSFQQLIAFRKVILPDEPSKA